MFSRIMLLAAWFARPAMMNSAFSTFIIPCLGFLFLPFTTLMYVILVQGANTIQGLDWLWLGLAVLLDIASIAGAGVANRDRIPAGVPGSYQGQTAAPPPAPAAAPAAAAAPIAAAAPVVPAAPAAPVTPPESKPADTQNT
jgi:UDP-N-acetylmuramyl pentapeptide phosphotransferase/UDP-N-acetylglucosamine-1-phosphate transferase